MVAEERPHKRALVTGATGYIGGQLVSRLLQLGWCVSTVGRNSQNTSKFQLLHPEVQCYALAKNNTRLSEILRDASPDVVFHCASMTTVGSSEAALQDLCDANISFGTRLLSAMAQNGVKNFLNVGTYFEHYNNDSFNPVDLYAASKHAFLSVVRYFNEVHGIKSVTLELYDVYGPNDTRPKIINYLIRAAMSGERIGMSPGNQRLNFVYVADVLDGFLIATDKLLASERSVLETFALRSEENYSLKEVAEFVQDVIGEKIKIEWGALDYKDRTIMAPPDITPVLGCWRASTSFVTGLKAVCEDAFRRGRSQESSVLLQDVD